MKDKKKVLDDLIRKTQDERFKKGKLPKLIYDIRMNKFKEKISEIDEELPVLESKLKSKKNSKKKKKK